MSDKEQTTKKTPISEEVFNSICELIEDTDIGTDKACVKHKVSSRSFREYLRIVGDSAELKYARAKSNQIDTLLDQMADLESQCMEEVRQIDDPKRANAIVQAYKIRVDNLKWIASKLKPKKYGDKLTLDGDVGIKINRAIDLPGKKSDGENVAVSE
jgi:hypothetical protein